MSMRIITKSNKAFIVVGKALMKTETGLRKGLHEGGLMAKREVVRLINEPPKTGRVYTIGGLKHQASAAGEAPATLTGELARGVSIKTVSATQLILGDRAPHGGFLEHGTKNMKRRPHLEKGAINTSIDMVNALLTNVKREMEAA